MAEYLAVFAAIDDDGLICAEGYEATMVDGLAHVLTHAGDLVVAADDDYYLETIEASEWKAREAELLADAVSWLEECGWLKRCECCGALTKVEEAA